MLTIAAEEMHRGWGGPIAILIAVAIFIAIATVHDHFKESQDPSPTGKGGRGVRVNSQVTEVSDTDDTDSDTGWWGRIVDRDGRRWRQVAHVVRTGASLPAEGIDLALDEEEDEEADETLEEYVDRLDRAGVGYAEIVREAMDEYRVSEATAKRRIREARESRAG